MNISNLTQQLKAQVQKDHALTLNESLLSSQLVKLINAAFQLESNSVLQITGLASGDVQSSSSIPDSVIVNGGKSSLLNLKNVSIDLVFFIQDNAVEIIIQVSMSQAWSFQNSFPALNVFPFNELEISDALFLYASTNQKDFVPIGIAKEQAKQLNLVKGLNFVSQIKVSELPVIGSLFSLGNNEVQLTGAFSSVSIHSLPVGHLEAQLESGALSLGKGEYAVEIDNPAFAITIGKATGNAQSIECSIKGTSSYGLNFSTSITDSKQGQIVFTAVPEKGKEVSFDEMVQLPGGKQFSLTFFKEFNTILKEIYLENFSVLVNTLIKTVNKLVFKVKVNSPRKERFGEIELNIESLTISLSNLSTGTVTNSITLIAQFPIYTKAFTDPIELLMMKTKTGSEIFKGNYKGKVYLKNLALAVNSNLSLPKEFEKYYFSDITASFDSSNNSYSLSASATNWFTISPFKATGLSLDLSYANQVHTFKLNGDLAIGDYKFDITVDLSLKSGAQNVVFIAKWPTAKSSPKDLTIQELIKALECVVPALPNELDLSLEKIQITYDFTTQAITVLATTKSFGNLTYVSYYPKGSQEQANFMGIEVNKSISLSNIPLIGHELSQIETIDMDKFQLQYSSLNIGPSATNQISLINRYITEGYPTVPSSGIEEGGTVAATINLGSETVPISIDIFGDVEQSGKNSNSQSQVTSGVKVDNTGNVSWKSIQQSFGPVYFNKIGFCINDNEVCVLLDASLLVSGLTVSVIGLSLSFSLNSFEPQFNIEGLGVDYSNGSLKIGGAFEKVPLQSNAFEGTVVVETERLSLSALGEYAEVNGHPSLFAFVNMDEPLGGPGFFFVTGLSGGLGYNSQIKIPATNKVDQFPFVEWSDGNNTPGSKATPAKVLTQLNENLWVTPALGDNWLAAGIQFTTYELVRSYAMLIAQTGNSFAVSMVGVSKAGFPKGSSTRYAWLELQLESTVNPQEDTVSFTSVLSPNSYVLDKHCHLRGGFALYFWYGSNANAGDFVLTAGGYSPYFSPPSYYPSVSRLKFNWSLDSKVSITGKAYFALTPAALMAGGDLDVDYHDHDLKAWFKAHADIIMWYNPFHFEADIGVNVGVSYKVDLLFCSVTFRASLGADLELWGPSTGGKAKIHWCHISFTVDFGADRTHNLKKQTWKEFQKVLPESEHRVKITPQNGLISQESNTWKVRSDEFKFTTYSAIPITQLTVNGEKSKSSGDNLNIKPMEVTKATSKQTIVILSEDGKNILNNKSWNITYESGAYPEALWGTGNSTKLKNGDSLVRGNFSGFTIQTQSKKPSGAVRVDTSYLKYSSNKQGENPLSKPKITIGFPAATSNQTVEDIAGIMDNSVKTERNSIHKVLSSIGFTELKNESLTELAADAGKLFENEPLLTA